MEQSLGALQEANAECEATIRQLRAQTKDLKVAIDVIGD